MCNLQIKRRLRTFLDEKFLIEDIHKTATLLAPNMKEKFMKRCNSQKIVDCLISLAEQETTSAKPMEVTENVAAGMLKLMCTLCKRVHFFAVFERR